MQCNAMQFNARQHNNALQCTNQAPPGTPQALDLNSRVFQTVNAINLSRVMLTAKYKKNTIYKVQNTKKIVKYNTKYDFQTVNAINLSWVMLTTSKHFQCLTVEKYV